MLQKCKVKYSKYVKYKYFGTENRYNLKYKDRISDKEFQSQLSANYNIIVTQKGWKLIALYRNPMAIGAHLKSN